MEHDPPTPSLFPVTQETNNNYNDDDDDDDDDNLYFNTVKTHQDYILDNKQKKSYNIYLSIFIKENTHS